MNTGYVNVNCSTSAANGISGQPITIKAENERQAFIDGDGSVVPFNMINCSYWTIEGLHVKSADNPANRSNGSVMQIDKGHHFTIRRNLLTNNNRYANGAILETSLDYSFFEENEMYWFHRNGFSMGNNNIIRRNYLNSRGYSDLRSPGYPSIIPNRGDVSIVLYPASNNIIENNISEGGYAGFSIQNAYGQSTDNKFLGNISIGDLYGFLIQARIEGHKINFEQMPFNTVMQNNMALDSANLGVYLRGNKNTQIDGLTVIGAGISGLQADIEEAIPGDGAPTVYGDNVLVINTTYGFYVKHPYRFTFNNTVAYNNRTNYTNKGATGDFVNSRQIGSNLGTCRAWIPSTSPMKGTGVNGADVGANILYRYQEGVLTTTPLWDLSTGEYPHGAIVPGVNDIAGSSAFDVHKRLNVNTNGCPFPRGYGTKPLSPKHRS
jgi:hypothetical protein